MTAPRPSYDWPNAANLLIIVAACLLAWLILAGVWQLILFLIRLVTQ